MIIDSLEGLKKQSERVIDGVVYYKWQYVDAIEIRLKQLEDKLDTYQSKDDAYNEMEAEENKCIHEWASYHSAIGQYVYQCIKCGKFKEDDILNAKVLNGVYDGYGHCSDCIWYNVPEGCNVARDSERCILNKKSRDTFKTIGAIA